ncbi:MAG: cytochrome c [Chloroflexi bacterium]|nr:MAG: cytochrome c [Chloroflexota bacterium]
MRSTLLLLAFCLFLTACQTAEATAVPAPYRGAAPPSAGFLTDPANIEAGRVLFQRHCAACHGQTGHGDGPAGHTLRLKPANLADPFGTARQPPDYWFWRVSEGGRAEPFHSRGSIMPAWKHHLTEEERWQVIAFARTLAGQD